jgi:hypothetical protein
LLSALLTLVFVAQPEPHYKRIRAKYRSERNIGSPAFRPIVLFQSAATILPMKPLISFEQSAGCGIQNSRPKWGADEDPSRNF